MGLRAVNRSGLVLAAAIVMHSLGELRAQDSPSKENSPVRTSRFFDRPIDYWQRGIGYGKEKGTDSREDTKAIRKPEAVSPPSDWGQVVKLPDGSLAYHELPKPLVRVLEDPSPENIRGYLEWRMSRAQKILRAAELMKEFKGAAASKARADGERSQAPPLPADSPVASNPPKSVAPDAATSAFSIKYFHKQGCPHCDTQDAILGDWLKDKPQGKLEIVEFGNRPDLWRAYGVRGTPSIVLEDSGTKRTVFLEGLSRAEGLDAALRECRAQGRAGTSSKEK